MNSQGIIYVATQDDRFVDEACASAKSAKTVFPGCPVTLFTDRPHHLHCETGLFDIVINLRSTPRFVWQWIAGLYAKVYSLQFTPYERTLFLDTDTIILTSELPELFAVLDTYDIALTEATADCSSSRQYFGRPMLNTGVILYKRNDQVWSLLREWLALSERNFRLAGGRRPSLPSLEHVENEMIRRRLLGNDQVSLAEILSPEENRLGVLLKILDHPWNHRGLKQFPIKIKHWPR